MGSCQQDEAATEDALHADMLQYYAESRGLAETSADSVCNYYTKFASFHNQHPECEADELYPPTVENLGNAFTQYGIVQVGNIIVKTEWDGEIIISIPISPKKPYPPKYPLLRDIWQYRVQPMPTFT